MQFIHKIGSGLVGTNFATTQGGTEEKKFFVLQIAFLGPKFQKKSEGGNLPSLAHWEWTIYWAERGVQSRIQRLSLI